MQIKLYLKIFSVVFVLIFLCCQKSGDQMEVLKKISNKKIILSQPEREIKLMIGNGPVLGMPTMMLVLDSSFVVSDHMSKLVVEYSFNGNYIRTIGKVGRGPGEYFAPIFITTDNNENIYIYDRQRINLYDMKGQFIKNLNANNEMNHAALFSIENFGDILSLAYSDGIVYLKKYSRANLAELYSLPLTEKEKSLLLHFIPNSGFCYNSLTNRIYFNFPGDFQIKEIDAHTGKVLSIFGIEPPHFFPLEEKYYNMIDLPNPAEYRKISRKITKLGNNFILIDNKFLVGQFFQFINNDKITSLFCYDLETKEKMDVKIDTDLTIGSSTVEKNKKLYSLLPASEEEAEVCNAKIAIFSYKILD